jgi:hypothetical protein
MKYRVFTKHLGWAECMYLFSENISFKMIKQTSGINILTKQDYVGQYEFDEKFISYFNKKEENNIIYYIKMSYDK